MGGIDTKPIEPVGSALSLSGDTGDQKKYQPRGSKRDCEKELEELSKELANCKVQSEAKHAAHMQALLKLEQNQKMTYELSMLIKKSDIDRNKYTNECIEGRARIEELESKVKEMNDQHLETAKIRDQLSHALSELKSTQRELLNKEVSQTDPSKAEAEERNNENNDKHIRVSLEGYESLDVETGEANEVQASTGSDLAFLKKQLEVASLKIMELRAHAEQALHRAELAEKGKASLEDKLRRQKEHRLRRRAALSALREVSTPEHFGPSTSDGKPKAYQPLGEVLNMKL